MPKHIIATLLVLLIYSCSGSEFNECGLVGTWITCDSSPPLTIQFEDDGDLFIRGESEIIWSTEDNCTELVLEFQNGQSQNIEKSKDYLGWGYSDPRRTAIFCQIMQELTLAGYTPSLFTDKPLELKFEAKMCTIRNCNIFSYS